MPDGGDPRGAMDVDPDVALVGDQRLAGMDPHPNPNRPAERGLAVGRSGQRVAGPRERHEEGIALRVDLDATVPLEGVADDAPVLGKRVRVGVAEVVEQAGGPLDVGEEEGDGAAGELSHPAIIPPSGGGRKCVVLVQLLASVETARDLVRLPL